MGYILNWDIRPPGTGYWGVNNGREWPLMRLTGELSRCCSMARCGE